MAARMLDGKAVAAAARAELRARIEALRARSVTPTLSVLLVGDNPQSAVYVRNKERAAHELGIRVIVHRVTPETSRDDLERLVAVWNRDSAVHGIIVQHPVRDPHTEAALRSLISPWKDVDALHPENVGLLAQGHPRFLPPTPAGIQELLVRSGVKITGAQVVIVGRGMLVGKPLALLLLQKGIDADATVTICHRETPDLPSITRTADILVVAAGVPRLITAEHVRPGSVVVDVGIHQTPTGWVGDVDRVSVENVAAAISPVPGGVGPMTVTMLLKNVLRAAEMVGRERESLSEA
ncbi:MAG: bifunctional 5,10-methylenetetrahydrofolate dehydrogenase/5,10-methenyltetrahydrofolate cyclohydrolase [bacterium]|nr:bifunctional 5,10-methylenetetrahydrofolate dehydrogenase/5,10-methenyltetrahydrofolate cyclohydrolase [bacterium]